MARQRKMLGPRIVGWLRASVGAAAFSLSVKALCLVHRVWRLLPHRLPDWWVSACAISDDFWERALLLLSNVSYLYLGDAVKRAVDMSRVRQALRRNRYKPIARHIFVEPLQPRGLIGPESQSTRLWWPPHASWMWRMRELRGEEALCARVFADDDLFDELKRRVVDEGATRDTAAIQAIIHSLAK